MIRHYRAVPLDVPHGPSLEEHRLQAASDLDAADQAKRHFGSHMPFVLWEGERRALTHQTIAHLLRTATRTRVAAT